MHDISNVYSYSLLCFCARYRVEVNIEHSLTCFCSLKEWSILFFLSQVVIARDSWIVRIRVCRMWDSINAKKNKELISLDMILLTSRYLNTHFFFFYILLYFLVVRHLRILFSRII